MIGLNFIFCIETTVGVPLFLIGGSSLRFDFLGLSPLQQKDHVFQLSAITVDVQCQAVQRSVAVEISVFVSHVLLLIFLLFYFLVLMHRTIFASIENVTTIEVFQQSLQNLDVPVFETQVQDVFFRIWLTDRDKIFGYLSDLFLVFQTFAKTRDLFFNFSDNFHLVELFRILGERSDKALDILLLLVLDRLKFRVILQL